MVTTSPHHASTSSFETTYTPPISQISETWDGFLAATSLTCFVGGTFGNVLALIYFANKRKDLPTKIYILMAITDAVSCFFVIAVGLSFINERKAVMFQITWLCDVWSTVWNITPYFSVFLVLVLSVVRTISLTNPFRNVHHNVVLSVIFLYLLYLLARIIVPKIMKLVYSEYDHDFQEHVYCGMFSHEIKSTVFHFQIASNVIQLTGPVIPIVVSCVISCYCVMKSRKATALSRKTLVNKKISTLSAPGISVPGARQLSLETQSSDASNSKGRGTWRKMKDRARNISTISTASSASVTQDKQVQATITILLVTGMYIVFNIPVFIYYLFYVIELYLVHEENRIFLPNGHVNAYGWNLVFVQCVALNAALNPIIYCWRIQKMRHFYSRERIKDWFRNVVDIIKIRLGLMDPCHRRSQVLSLSVSNQRTYVEVLTEDAAV